MLLYKYGRASAEGMNLVIKGNDYAENPIKTKCRVIPLHNLRVGDSLMFHKEEMVRWKYELARETMNRYNRKYNNMFVVLFNDDKTRMEIVRIK